MKAARAGHVCTVQFLISKGRLTCSIKTLRLKVIIPEVNGVKCLITWGKATAEMNR